MNFTKREFDAFRVDLREAVKGVEEKYNIKINDRNISYDETSFTLKLEAKKNEMFTEEFEINEFKTAARLYGFKPEDYKRNFEVNDRGKMVIYELVGFNPKATKNTCKIRDIQTGRRYACPPRFIKNAVGE